MTILLRRIYSIWCLLCFLIPFLCLYPFFWLAYYRRAYTTIGYLNKIWAWCFLRGSGLPFKVHYHFRPSPKAVYVLCSNHNSYLDIILMGLIAPPRHAFVGKHSLTKVPLFGRMFAKLHIPVKRESKTAAYKALLKMRAAAQAGRSIIIFPEGGIRVHELDRLAPFKDGAFKLAIDLQIPVIPIAFPFNWKVLPDDQRFLPRYHRLEAVVLPPIPTKGCTEEDLETIKQRTYDAIYQALKAYYPDLKYCAPSNGRNSVVLRK
ncbi:lysophospholipid acyltransferase family protein [Thermonema rossianum]|uniref:lysophospholipid acyltransferase family protein n=1 Tax=Thermonema rossianum TaxID=55505 RepID=UPI00068A82F4|nr:lysophospholipid acyltransferase family protein [Thermonema rossianum]